MAYHFTRSRARSELECSDVEPSDVAPVAATSSSPSSTIVRPSVAAIGGPESMSTESAGPVSPLFLSQRDALPPPANSVCYGLRVLLKWGSLPWGTPAVRLK